MSKEIKKVKNLLLCSLIAACTCVIPVSAEWTGDIDEREWTPSLEFFLTGGEAGMEVTGLSSGTVGEVSISDPIDKWNYEPQVTVSATMDGENPAKWYWSKTAYKNTDGAEETVAVLKADASQPWNENSAVILKLEDMNSIAGRIQIEMGASADGPRDYKMEYSVDGEHYYTLKEPKEQIVSVKEAYTIKELFDEMLKEIPRNYKLHTINYNIVREDNDGIDYNKLHKTNEDIYRINKDGVAYTVIPVEDDIKLYEDVYFKISPASDYKVNGETGLYGSSTGEIALRMVRFKEPCYVTDDMEGSQTSYITAPTNIKAYKVSSKTAKLTWKKAASVDGYEIYLKKGKNAYKKVKTIKTSQKTNCQLKNLSNSGIYKIRLRSYTEENGVKYYSSYTKAITLNMKKQLLPKDLRVAKKVKVKAGERKKMAVKCTAGKNKNLIKSITYKVKNNKIAQIKSGVIKGRKAGSTTVTTKVTLKSGLSKIFTTKVQVVR